MFVLLAVGFIIFRQSVGHIAILWVDIDMVEQVASQVLTKWPEIDGVVNNAGITKDQLLLRMKAVVLLT